MEPVRDQELDWIRQHTPSGPALSSALPGGFAVYGALDTSGDDPAEDHALLDAVALAPDEVLLAGALIRDLMDEHEPGTAHRLYADWPYRFRRRTVGDLHRRIDGEGRTRWQNGWALPEVLFPDDRRWLISTLWDDSWRSIGADAVTASRIIAAFPAFEQIGREVDLNSTGRRPF